MYTFAHMKTLVTSLGPIVGLVALWLIGMPIFAYQHNRRGRPKTDRIAQAGGSPLLGPWLMEYWMSHEAFAWDKQSVHKFALRVLSLVDRKFDHPELEGVVLGNATGVGHHLVVQHRRVANPPRTARYLSTGHAPGPCNLR